jgi:hypothetical protein
MLISYFENRYQHALKAFNNEIKLVEKASDELKNDL